MEVIAIKCIGILWNTVNHLKNEILTDILNICNISDIFEYDFGNQYESFVKEIYRNDGIADWKIDLKINSMKKIENKKIIIIFIDIDDSEKYYNDKKNKIVSKTIESLKANIRNKYSHYIDNYFFDNIFHMNDNENELIDILNVLKIWLPEAYKKYINNGTNVKIRKKEKNENKQSNNY